MGNMSQSTYRQYIREMIVEAAQKALVEEREHPDGMAPEDEAAWRQEIKRVAKFLKVECTNTQ